MGIEGRGKDAERDSGRIGNKPAGSQQEAKNNLTAYEKRLREIRIRDNSRSFHSDFDYGSDIRDAFLLLTEFVKKICIKTSYGYI